MKLYQTFAIISMVFAGLTAVIAKMGLKNISGDTGIAVRTTVVLILVWINVFVFSGAKDFNKLTINDFWFLALSALTTSISWIFYYKAIKIGNVSEVALIDKASIVITLILSFTLLHEQFTWKTVGGGLLIICGLLILTLK